MCIRDSGLADQLQVCDAGQQSLDPASMREGDGDLLVGPGQLRCDDYAVAQSGVADTITVAELALTGSARASGEGRTNLPLRLGGGMAGRPGGLGGAALRRAAWERAPRHVQAAGPGTRVVGVALRPQVPR